MPHTIGQIQYPMRKLPYHELTDRLDKIYCAYFADRESGSRNKYAITEELWFVLDALAYRELRKKKLKETRFDIEDLCGTVVEQVFRNVCESVLKKENPEPVTAETELKKVVLDITWRKVNGALSEALKNANFSNMTNIPTDIYQESRLYTLSMDTPVGKNDDEEKISVSDTLPETSGQMEDAERRILLNAVMSRIAANIIHFQQCRGVGYSKMKKWFYPLFYTEQIASLCEGQKELDDTPRDIILALNRNYLSFFAENVPTDDGNKFSLRQLRCRESVVLPSGKEQKVFFRNSFLPAAIPIGYSRQHDISATDSLLSNLRANYLIIIRDWGSD